MLRSMYSAVSGLKTHQTRMDVIGNNIANVNTVAFKSSSVTFSDILYQTLRMHPEQMPQPVPAVSMQSRSVSVQLRQQPKSASLLQVHLRQPEIHLISV